MRATVSEYAAPCAGGMRTTATSSVFGGSALSTSCFSRRSTKGRISCCTLATLGAHATPSPLPTLLKRAEREARDPLPEAVKRRGATKESSVRSSAGLFSTGVPVSSSRWHASTLETFWCTLLLSFLSFCASSTTRYDSLPRAPTRPSLRWRKACSCLARSLEPEKAVTPQTTTCGGSSSLRREKLLRTAALVASSPWNLTTRRAGHHIANSRIQFSRVATGATTRCGPSSPSPSSCASSEMVCTVLPSPISSARMPPVPCWWRPCSQDSPISW
mmetsp:Transcript_1666/g.5383  ORF Transcript_1666/g.5383 Transcript_1666/m.5383 type:complete len:274 (+) Transcript_1666:1043-1864(+)